MIFEAIITTTNADGGPHISPLGYRWEDQQVVLAPFVPSRTLENLQRTPTAVLNFTDDVRVFAGCLTGRRDWPTVPTEQIDGWRLETCLSHIELAITATETDPVRPKFYAEVAARHTHAPFVGFNRAQAAVVEAAILFSRLDRLPAEKVASEIQYLSIAVEKTAGPRETEAWRWLIDRIQQHPRHRLLLAEGG